MLQHALGFLKLNNKTRNVLLRDKTETVLIARTLTLMANVTLLYNSESNSRSYLVRHRLQFAVTEIRRLTLV